MASTGPNSSRCASSESVAASRNTVGGRNHPFAKSARVGDGALVHALGVARLERAADRVARMLADHRTDRAFAAVTGPSTQPIDLSSQLGEERALDLVRDDDAARRGALLSRITHRASRRERRRLRDVRVGQHDRHVLAAHLRLIADVPLGGDRRDAGRRCVPDPVKLTARDLGARAAALRRPPAPEPGTTLNTPAGSAGGVPSPRAAPPRATPSRPA